MLYTKKIKILIFISFLCVSACRNSNVTGDEQDNFRMCIPPIEDFAYSTSVDTTKPIAGVDFVVEPQQPWHVESVIPNIVSASNIPVYGQGVTMVRERIGYTEVWVQLFRLDNQNLGFTYEYAIYRSDTKEWRTIIGTVNDNPSIHVVDLFADAQGSIWGQNFWAQNTHDPMQFPFLSHFDDTLDIFELEERANSIPAFLSDGQGDLWLGMPRSKMVFNINNGDLWVLAHQDGIYNYNIHSHQTQKFASLDANIRSVTLNGDGSLYYNITTTSDNRNSQDLRRFFVSTGIEVVPINLTFWSGYSNILTDRDGNLWLDAVGWKSPEGNWYQVHPSPLFITNIKHGASDSRMQVPHIEAETSDGRLWFRSDNGMIWLDPEKGEWCWFTTYQSNIVEDADRNLWMSADGKLYKMPLGENK
jgi:hypothetical protein